MRLFLLLPLLALLAPPAHAESNTIHVESHADGGESVSTNISSVSNTSSNTTTTTQSSTKIYTNVNGKETVYESDKPVSVTVTNDGKNPTTSENTKDSQAEKTKADISKDLADKKASFEAKIKAEKEKAQKRLEEQKQKISEHNFSFKVFFLNLFKSIFGK